MTAARYFYIICLLGGDQARAKFLRDVRFDYILLMTEYAKTTALSINRYDFSETSQIVKFFSRELGAFNAIAKGAKRAKNTVGGPFDLLHTYEIEIVVKPPEHLNILVSAEVERHYLPIRRDLDKLAVAGRILFLINELLPFHEKNRPVYDLTVDTLDSVSRGTKPYMDLLWFETNLLQGLGYLPGMDACASCGSSLGVGRGGAFSPCGGGALCFSCASGSRDVIRAGAGVFVFLGNLLRSRMTRFDSVGMDGALFRETMDVLDRYFAFVIERPVRACI